MWRLQAILLGFVLGWGLVSADSDCLHGCISKNDELSFIDPGHDWTPDYLRLYLTSTAELEAAGSEEDRWLALPDAAFWSIGFGSIELAEALAWEAWDIQSKHWETMVLGDLNHKTFMALGRASLRKGDTDQAILFLLRAAQLGDGPATSTFGPSMLLAKELLHQGESAAVLEYLELCGEFWEHGNTRLELWTQAIHRGEMPEFGINLSY